MGDKPNHLREAVFNQLKLELDEVYVYHSLKHTQQMLKILPIYLEGQDISEEHEELLEIAVLFHDVGFIEDWRNHEEIGAKKAAGAMRTLGYSEEAIRLVERLIIATRIPQEPVDKLECIICDLDLDYLGRPDYEQRSELLFQEWKALGIVNSREEWELKEIRFLENHQFHTPYGLKHRQPVLLEHIQRIRSEKTS